MNPLNRLRARGALAALAFAVAGLAAAAVPGAALAAPGGSPVVGHVYVNDNTAPTNTVAAFARHADGTLTALPGSPFAVGGAGPGHGLASQGAIALADGGRYLLAVDAGSNQISVARVAPDGSLRAVPGGTVGSGGSAPDSIAVHGDLVYVANAGSLDSNYTGFVLTPAGRLRPLSGSTVTVASNAAPGDVFFNPTGTKLVATLVGTSQIDSLVVGDNGLLTRAPGSPYTAQGLGPFGSQFSPTDPAQLFVTNAHNGTGLGSVSAFNDAADGTLSSIGSSPFADQQTAPCWLVVNPDGQHLYAINTASGSVSSYAIAADGSLTLLTSTPIGNGGGGNAIDDGITPDGRWLYVDEGATHAVGEFSVNGGTVTELTGSPVALPAGATPSGIAVN